MLCSVCRIRRATRYGTYPRLVMCWCEYCAQGRGKPMHYILLRPLTVVWTRWMNIRGGRRGRKERLAKAARAHGQ